MTIRIISTLALVALTSACATRSDNIPAAYISPIQYQGYSCSQISQEAARLSGRTSQAIGAQDARASNDEATMAIGMIIFWPALFFNKGDGAEAAEVARLKGEIEALEKASIAKNCNIAFRKAPTVAAKPETTEKPKASSFSKRD